MLGMLHPGEQLDAGQLLAAQIDLRLVPEVDPVLAQRDAEIDPLRMRDRGIELVLLDHPADDAALDRLGHRRQDLQRIALGEVLDGIEPDIAAAAHKLQRATVGAVDQRPHRLHRMARNDRDVEEHQIRRAQREAHAQVLRTGKSLGLDSVSLQHQGHETPMILLIVDDETDRRPAIEGAFRRRARAVLVRTKPATELVDHWTTGTDQTAGA
jgi:hypothetical protein